jgi:UDP-2-acetamido-3-amino-2,3-dideoxy-glucuronate N-acetyltransferase
LKRKIKICVVGAGRWGLNHVKTLSDLNALGAVVDKNDVVLKSISDTFPNCQIFKKLNNDVIESFDGFIVATEPSSHFRLAKKIIMARKPVLVEKPLTLDHKSSIILCDLAKKMNVNLMVGHVLLFHPAFLKMKKLIEDGKIGNIQYIYSNRVNLGTVRTNENVFWSFAPHDIALFNFFLKQSPIEINSNGIDLLQKNIHDTSVTTFHYEGNKMGHIFVSWLHPFKEHRFVIIGTDGMLHFEDSMKDKPLNFYDKKVKFINGLPAPIDGNIKQIEYEPIQPLKNQLKYFLSKIDNGVIEISDGESGAEVIRILEIATRSLNS